MGAACLPASGNPVPSNVVPCSPTVPCSHQPANRFQFSSTDSLPAAGSSAWAGGLCVLCRSSPPRPTLAATLPFFPHPLPAVPVASGHPLNPTGPALPLPRPPAATVWIVSSQQIDICFPACTITSPWSTPPLRRDYQRGVSIAEVGAAATQYLDNVRQRDSRAPRPTSERTRHHSHSLPTHYTPNSHNIHPATGLIRSNPLPFFANATNLRRKGDPRHRQHAGNSPHESHQGGHQFAEPHRPGL